jgi:hypothetical protein
MAQVFNRSAAVNLNHFLTSIDVGLESRAIRQ